MNKAKPYITKKPKLEADIKFRLPTWTDKQFKLIEILQAAKNKMCFITGPAGTAKSFTTVYTALELLKQKKVGEMVYTRSLVQSSPNPLGILPGELDNKTHLYNLPLYDKLSELLNKGDIDKVTPFINNLPINFMRGVNFSNNVIIVDEAQNCTHEELVTIATRVGEQSRLWFVGDLNQSDLRNGHKQDFKNFSNRFRGEEHEAMGIQHFKFNSDDILRSEICKHIVKTLEVE